MNDKCHSQSEPSEDEGRSSERETRAAAADVRLTRTRKRKHLKEHEAKEIQEGNSRMKQPQSEAQQSEARLITETALVLPGESSTTTLLPALIAQSDPHTARRFLEFFTVTIRNQNTRRAYARAAGKFLDYCEKRGIADLKQIEPMLVAAFIESETKEQQPQTVKQELAAIRMLFDYLGSDASATV